MDIKEIYEEIEKDPRKVEELDSATHLKLIQYNANAVKYISDTNITTDICSEVFTQIKSGKVELKILKYLPIDKLSIDICENLFKFMKEKYDNILSEALYNLPEEYNKEIGEALGIKKPAKKSAIRFFED